jgi:signal transduction histidine kinase
LLYLQSVNSLREYFIGDYLRQSPDILVQASIRLIYKLISVSLLSLAIFFSIYLLKGFHYQLVKSIVISLLFVGLLFYMKYRHTTVIVCHLLIVISWLNNNLNIYLFDDFNFFIALLTVCNIIFAFHTLGSKCGLGYSFLHAVPIAVHFVLRHLGIHMRTEPPAQITFLEGLVTLTLVFFILVYLIYHYHKAYELAGLSLRQSVAELEKSRELANEMTRLKTNFLSNMSHEIRTPINGILGISQIIELESKDETIRQYTQLQQQNGRRLLNTISSILELSRLEAGTDTFSMQAVEVNAIVRQSMQPYQPIAAHKKLSFTFEPAAPELVAFSDGPMLQQVINNVVGNAIKFTDKGHVLVNTFFVQNKHVVIRIEDTGLGISEEFLPRVFNPFEQESTGRNRSYEGTGLGLSISRRYLDLLKGDILVSSVKGKGSTFQIVLPVYRQAT